MSAVSRLALAGVLLLPGCSGWQSSLDPQAPQAGAIAGLIWIFTGVAGVVWVLVMIALALALIGRKRGPFEVVDPLAPAPAKDRRARKVIAAAIGATALILLALTGLSYSTQKALFTDQRENELVIRVTGYQWWWDVRYEDPEANQFFNTANELHVPVGRPIRVILTASDVIHSFWVPSLTGKMDLIPGRQNELVFSAERAGLYRGQCAEFCGYQHAHMGMFVVAEPAEEFEAWRQAQLASAVEPNEPERKRGKEVFLRNPCASCHTVRGTPAGSRAGPELTHVGSRESIAAGTLPMSRGNLAAWIVDPQRIKPGAKMPTIKLAPGDANAVAAYLEGLK